MTGNGMILSEFVRTLDISSYDFLWWLFWVLLLTVVVQVIISLSIIAWANQRFIKYEMPSLYEHKLSDAVSEKDFLKAENKLLKAELKDYVTRFKTIEESVRG